MGHGSHAHMDKVIHMQEYHSPGSFSKPQKKLYSWFLRIAGWYARAISESNRPSQKGEGLMGWRRLIIWW